MAAAAVIPNVSRLSSRIIRVLGCNPGLMTLQGTNTYIIGTGKRRILLDTGDADVPQYINHLSKVLQNDGINLAHIFISHWHHDHIGGLENVLTLQGHTDSCKIWKYPHPEGDNHFDGVKFEYLKDGQEFQVDGATVRVIHTPGHTTDHIILHLLEENAVFSADCILGEGTAVFEDLHDYMISLKTILDLKPNIIYPGHGNIINEPHDKIKYYIDHRNQREKQILEVLSENQDKQLRDMDIVKLIYTDTPEDLFPAACYNVNHHLSKLLKENKIQKINGDLWQIKKLTPKM